jgi:putative transposase
LTLSNPKSDGFNTDQGSQFTSLAFTEAERRVGAAVSTDGQGRWMDNVFIKRLWRSLKYECVYPQAPETGSQARAAIGDWIDFSTRGVRTRRLMDAPPHEVYYGLDIQPVGPVAA